MNRTGKLMKAYADLNSWKWNDMFGSKPDGFDDLPDYKGSPCKNEYIKDHFQWLENELPEWKRSWAWWKYELNRSFLMWVFWYNVERKRGLI